MLVSIGSYAICDGTLNGGVAVSDLRLSSDRLYDFVVPVGDVDAILLDRINSKSEITFMVKRTFSTKPTAEKFLLQLDDLLPVSGVVTLTTTGPSPATRTIPNGYIVDHALVDEQGATLFHQYHILGGPPVAP